MKVENIWEAQNILCDWNSSDPRTWWDFIRDAVNGLDNEEETATLLTGEFYQQSWGWNWQCPTTSEVLNYRRTLKLHRLHAYNDENGYPIFEYEEEPYEWAIPDSWEEFDKKLDSSEDFVKDFFKKIRPWTLYE